MICQLVSQPRNALLNRTKSSLGFPIFKSLVRLIRYHLGSVAFGSFLVALIQFIRIIMKYVERRIKKYDSGPAGKCIRGVLKCCQCCLLCFEKFIKFINKNAYIEVGKANSKLRLMAR